jgi:hypothetical protein
MEKGDVVRGGWAEVARRLFASSSVWVAAMPFFRKVLFGQVDCFRMRHPTRIDRKRH